MLVAVGVGPELEQGAEEALDLAVGRRPMGPRLADGDPAPLAALCPATFEAGAVVGEDALDPDPVQAVEALAGGQEGQRRVCASSG